MSAQEMKQPEREKMIKALAKLKEAVTEISELWEGDESGITPFDDILSVNYPFNESFYDAQHNIIEWTKQATEKLNK